MSNVVHMFGSNDKVRAYKLYVQADKLDGTQWTAPAAERLYREAIRLDPTMAQAHTNLGNVLYERGDFAGAVRQYRTALRVDPEQPEAAYNLGVVYHDRCDTTRAIALFELTLRTCPLEDRKLLADTHYRLALSRDEIGDAEGARQHWHRLLELEPEGEWADYARTWLEQANRKPDLKVVR